jgi:hypothetical protein
MSEKKKSVLSAEKEKKTTRRRPLTERSITIASFENYSQEKTAKTAQLGALKESTLGEKKVFSF